MPDSPRIPGLSSENDPSVGAETKRPLSSAWISPKLLRNALAVWSSRYGRPLTDEEGIEILMNVKRLGEAMVDLMEHLVRYFSRIPGQVLSQAPIIVPGAAEELMVCQYLILG